MAKQLVVALPSRVPAAPVTLEPDQGAIVTPCPSSSSSYQCANIPTKRKRQGRKFFLVSSSEASIGSLLERRKRDKAGHGLCQPLVQSESKAAGKPPNQGARLRTSFSPILGHRRGIPSPELSYCRAARPPNLSRIQALQMHHLVLESVTPIYMYGSPPFELV